MQKSSILRLLKETKYRPLKITINFPLERYTVYEYILVKGQMTKQAKCSGEQHECRKCIEALQRQDSNYLHIN